MNEMSFDKRLKELHAVGNELSITKSVNELCRRFVEAGRDRLGFDRISTWFVDANDNDYIFGSFGVDEKGRLREEVGERIRIDTDPVMKIMHRNKKAQSMIRDGVPLRDHEGRVVGRGSHIIASIWNGKDVIGYVSVDNLIKKIPYGEGDREILELSASTFGHLYSLKLAEEALVTAYRKLKAIQGQLIQAAKFEVIGGLASGAAHELKNPLAIVMQGVDYLSRTVTGEDENAHAALLRMRVAVKKADGILKGLLDFSALAKLDITAENINAVCDSALNSVHDELDKYGITVVKCYSRNVPDIKIDKSRIEQVLINLFVNAIHHMRSGGELKVTTCYNAPKKEERSVTVVVEDTGPGIPEEMLDKVFDPFFTTRRARGGTGLGLTIARNIMHMNGGSVHVENRKPGRGARATLVFRI